MVPLDILTKCHHKIWKCHQPLFHGPRLSHVIKGHQVSTNCHKYISQNVSTLFVMVPLDTQPKCHHKIWKCHQPFFHKPLQVMPLFKISFPAKLHQCVSANDPRLFLMVPLDILTKCHHKIWKCHQPFFHKPLQVMPLFNISFQPNAISVFLQMIPDFF